MTQRFAMRPLAAMLSSLRSDAVGYRLWRRDVTSTGRAPASGGALPGVQACGWRPGLRRGAKGLLRPVLGVLPLLMVALWHVAASAQGPAVAAPATATPQEAATVLELQVLQSQQALVSLRKLKTELGTIELLLHPRTNRYYIAVTSRTGQVRRVVRSDNERAAQLGFESFRRLAGQGEAGRPALLGETLIEAEAGAAAAAGGSAGNAGGTGTGGAAGAAGTAGKAGVGVSASPSASGDVAGRAAMPTQGATITQSQSRAPAPTSTSAASMGRLPGDAGGSSVGGAVGGSVGSSVGSSATTTSGSADVGRPAAPSQPTMAPMQAPPRSPLMDEVLRLQNAGRLTAMRRADNGSFNAQLFFQIDAARYFVLLAQGKDLWRVVQAHDSAQALRLYEDLAHQSAALAADELRRLELKAQTDAAERELRQAQAQTRQMAEEVEADRRYRAMIQAQENQSRADVSALQQQQRQLQEQLMAEQRRVMELRRQLDPSARGTAGAASGGGSNAGGPAAGGMGNTGGMGRLSGASTRRGAGQQECRIVQPGQPVSPSERDLPVCGLERSGRGQ